MRLLALRPVPPLTYAILAGVLAFVALPARGAEEKRCEQRLEQVLCAQDKGISACMQSLATAKNSPKFLLALVPDPVETGATNVFDRAVQAINEGIISAGYLRDRYWMPWTAPLVGGHPSEVDCAFNWPGLMVFRPAENTSFDRQLVVFVVGESSVYGVQRKALNKALDLILSAQPQNSGTRWEPLLILGPHYSGSVDSLRQALEQIQDKIPLTIASGAVQGHFARDRLIQMAWQQNCQLPVAPHHPPLRVKFFTASLKDRFNLLQDFIERAQKPVRMAQLSEAGTQFGLRETIDPYGRSELLQLNFPPHVAAEPASAGQQSRDQDPRTMATWHQSPVFAQQALPRDTIPEISTSARTIRDLVLVHDANTLRDEGIGDIVISVTAPEDTIVLARRLGQLLPDRRFALTALDLIQLHPELAAVFEGALVVTAFPQFGNLQNPAGNQGKANPEKVRHTLSRDPSVGMYYAARWLLKPEPPSPISCETADEKNTSSEVTPTVGVIARERFWPLYSRQSAGTLEIRPNFWWVAFTLWLLTAYGLSFLLLLQFRETARGGRWLNKFLFQPLKLLQQCQGPEFKRWHAFWLTVMASAALVLSAPFVSVCVLLAKRGGAWWVKLYALLWGLATLTSIVLPWLRVRPWWRSMKPWDPHDSYVWAFSPALFMVLGYVTAGYTLSGILSLEDPLAAMFLQRACRLAGGASPLFILIIVAACLALFGYSHAVRQRAINAPCDSATQRGMLWRAVPLCEPEEKLLLKCTSMPGGALFWGTFLAALGLCAYILLMARPVTESSDGTYKFKAWIANNTVENLALASAMMVGLFTVLSIVILRLCTFCRYVRGLLKLLRAMAASLCLAPLERVEPPMRASVTEQLSRGPHERWELIALWRALANAGVSVPIEFNENPQHSPFAASPEFQAMASQIEAMRMELGRPDLPEQWRTKAETAIATYVAFVLGRYIKQIRFFMLGLTQQLAALFACTLFYPFAARRALFAMFLILMLGALLAALTTLLSLERDPVLMRIAGSPSTLSTITLGMGRVLIWGAVPIAIALSSYFPSLAQRVMQIAQLFGLSP